MEMFEDFWKKYPRKVAKAHARKMWARLTEAQRILALEQLAVHIKAWDMEGRTSQYIPHPGSWLCGERWEDEISLAPQIPEKAVAWWANDRGILDKGRELGLHARGGESMHEFKSRVVEAARKAA